MLSSYFDYIFVHLRQKARLGPELSPKFCHNFRPEPELKSPARLTALLPRRNNNLFYFGQLRSISLKKQNKQINLRQKAHMYK